MFKPGDLVTIKGVGGLEIFREKYPSSVGGASHHSWLEIGIVLVVEKNHDEVFVLFGNKFGWTWRVLLEIA